MSHTLTRRLIRKPLRGLQHQHCSTLRRKLFRHRARHGAAHFFFAAQQQRHRSVYANLLQGCDRFQRHQHAGLDVHHTRPEELAISLAPRHLRERPHGPHCIQMREQHHSPAFAAAKAYFHHIAEQFLLVPLHLTAECAGPCGNQLAGPIDRGLVLARRLYFDQLAQPRQQPGLRRCNCRMDFLHFHHANHDTAASQLPTQRGPCHRVRLRCFKVHAARTHHDAVGRNQ